MSPVVPERRHEIHAPMHYDHKRPLEPGGPWRIKRRPPTREVVADELQEERARRSVCWLTCTHETHRPRICTSQVPGDSYRTGTWYLIRSTYRLWYNYLLRYIYLVPGMAQIPLKLQVPVTGRVPLMAQIPLWVQVPLTKQLTVSRGSHQHYQATPTHHDFHRH